MPLSTVPPRSRPAAPTRPRLGSLAAAVVAAALVVAVAGGLEPARTVAAITLDNPNEYAMTVTLVDGAGRRMPLATVPPRATVVVEDVADIGELWQFDTAAQGERTAGETLSRAELSRSRWRVSVGEETATVLRSRDIAATPPGTTR